MKLKSTTYPERLAATFWDDVMRFREKENDRGQK